MFEALLSGYFVKPSFAPVSYTSFTMCAYLFLQINVVPFLKFG